MTGKIWLWLIWIVWVFCMIVTRELFGWKAVGLYILGSVLYSAYVLIWRKDDD